MDNKKVGVGIAVLLGLIAIVACIVYLVCTLF